MQHSITLDDVLEAHLARIVAERNKGRGPRAQAPEVTTDAVIGAFVARAIREEGEALSRRDRSDVISGLHALDEAGVAEVRAVLAKRKAKK